jgi:hypothetical protein
MDNQSVQHSSRAQTCVDKFFEEYKPHWGIKYRYFEQKRVQLWLIYKDGFKKFWVHDTATGMGMELYPNYEIAKELREEIDIYFSMGNNPKMA